VGHCDDGLACTQDVCNDATGLREHPAFVDGTLCEG
jgi:hypothetical protein